MADFVIRDAALDDVPAISELIRRTVRLSNAHDYPAEVVELIAANHTPDKVAQRMSERDIFVCQAGHRIIGTVGLGDGKLRSLFVEPGLQQGGVGARLVAHLEAHALKAGVAELQLSSSLTARGFYERLGYRTIRFEERADGSTFLMAKTLVER
jgi:N-acetylglutamate synthase-like GNAT family acetyltransferase